MPRKKLEFLKQKWIHISKLRETGAGSLDKGISRYFARRSVYKAFGGIKLSGYSSHTVRGYNAIFAVYIAYSALDILTTTIAKHCSTLKQFQRFIKAKKDSRNNRFENYLLQIIDAEIASYIRQNYSLLEIISEETDINIEKDIISFCSHDHDNLISVCQGIRHLVAHGNLTASKAEGHSPKHAWAIEQCADLVISTADGILITLLDEIEKQSLGMSCLIKQEALTIQQ